ncbi:MAG TPA: hypothetical protein VG326_10010 [Tepidisphaeraceae bacterium]|nr:hypothetical protein [Tepidisphaeraceae bacterium]
MSALPLLAAVPQAALAEEQNAPNAGQDGNWVNVSENFIKRIGADNITPAYLRGCQGLIVTPSGELVIQTAVKGICVSKDQGATWSAIENNNIKGRCETGFGFSLAYPYDGRMAFFCYDGFGARSGGISLDHANTWRSFLQITRGVEFADIDWNVRDPQTILGMTHEPYRTVLSVDGGKSWQKLYKDNEAGELDIYKSCRLGVINDQTFARYNAKRGGIELSTASGQNWTLVADYKVIARRPVHYGKNIYWNTAKGVIVTSDGEHWTLTGPGAEDACYGPYFGANEQEFVVVTSKAFLKTEDGGKTWHKLAALFKATDIFHGNSIYCYFGWDAKHNLLYSSGLGASIYQLATATK